jgi:hypothetical protein
LVLARVYRGGLMFLVISFAPHGLWLLEMGLPFWLYIPRNNYNIDGVEYPISELNRGV